MSVVKSKETGEYVVSWLEETKKAPRGNFEIKVFDDEGYAAVRKVRNTHQFGVMLSTKIKLIRISRPRETERTLALLSL